MDVPLALQVTVALAAVTLYLIYRHFTEHFDYWEKKGVVFVKPWPVLGSMKEVLMVREHLAEFFERLYIENKPHTYFGYFMGKKPGLVITEPEMIKHVLIKDFSHFVDHGFDIHEEADPMQAKNLFFLEGQRWRNMRAKLVPTFTSGKMKGMLPLMLDVAKEFESKLEVLAKETEEFELRRLFACFFTDIVGTCIFGIQCNSIKDPDVEFRRVSRRLIELDLKGAMKAMVTFFVPELAFKLKLGLIDKEATNFFRKLVKDVMDMRKASGSSRKDFMQLLIELKEKGQVATDEADLHEIKGEVTSSDTNIKLTHDDLTAQATVFFLAGFDTSSSVSSYACMELALNPDVQKKLQDHIDEVLEKHQGKVTYEALKEMKYLECVLNETMRIHPVVANHIRKCNTKYTLPGTDLEIDPGVLINVPVSALNKDPKYFPNPLKFDPDRFLDEQVVQQTQFIFTPFGIGPRQCIGNRFAKLQSKLGLVTILRKFTLNLGSKTQLPLKLDKRQFIAAVQGGCWVTLTPRNVNY
ncbi:probable cytochrome P450 6a14 isoform X2 [Neocloeon triangulifer]|uniref:probable cytochrome P450 6a14 isoform X2 n=1 Tax=Neocloeon triangulifer TaxID=2078957 RepID=UPI00286F7231|nr:probable cytochrome P450 6a14 isoform X2 [Neocloeon triangulifer]XP_059478276.1 probable cytochrome P450 6a14 isoform X2 [Neocloeon triangulifer]XP_059478277.1 probable cytochrome P450 6a14 isoform X2 [Neocloeon triangulifer]